MTTQNQFDIVESITAPKIKLQEIKTSRTVESLIILCLISRNFQKDQPIRTFIDTVKKGGNKFFVYPELWLTAKESKIITKAVYRDCSVRTNILQVEIEQNLIVGIKLKQDGYVCSIQPTVISSID